LDLYDLAVRLRVSPRTVRRYVYALRDAGISVESWAGTDDDRPAGSAATRYRLDVRAWSGVLCMPED
jgi:hypothetical protein